MLMRSRQTPLNAPALYRKPLPTGLARTAFFLTESKRTQTTSAPVAKTKGTEQESQHDGNKQPKGSYLRALAPFVIGVPIGWAVHSLLDDDSKSSRKTTPVDFVKYTLAERQPVSSTCSIFTLKPTTSSVVDLQDPALNSAITSVQFKQPQLQIARSYTLLPRTDGQEKDELRFLIRRERNGEVSGYLHRLPVGGEIEVRGPSVDYVLPQTARTIAFLAGGTGIVPALQLSEKIDEQATLHILWANRRREDCIGGVSDTPATGRAWWDILRWWSTPSSSTEHAKELAGSTSQQSTVVAELENLKGRAGQCAKLGVDYFIDEEGTFIRPDNVMSMIGSISSHCSDESEGERLLFISGPEGFTKYWAGPKQWVNGQEVQGPLGGVLSTLDLRGWKVVKL